MEVFLALKVPTPEFFINEEYDTHIDARWTQSRYSKKYRDANPYVLQVVLHIGA
jgi:hypothetical protein